MAVNILYLINNLGHGGTEKQVCQLIQNLDRTRVMPHLCTLTSSNELFDMQDVPKFNLEFESFLKPSIFRVVAQLTGFIRKHKIHIVQTFFQDPFLLAALVKPLTGVKLIGSFRDLGFWRTSVESFKMRLAYPAFHGFIANSQAVKDHFVQVDCIHPDKIDVIYNGVELDRFTPRTVEDIERQPHVVGIVANLNRPVKRVQDFIRAAALVVKERPDTRFVIVGDGHLRTELEELSRSLGIDDVVSFVGRLVDPVDLIRSFHVGVITSETEGFCNAILEYMALGVPVVATAVGGNPELITDGENGFLVQFGDAELMAEKIKSLLDTNALCVKIRDANLAKVSSEYSAQSMFLGYNIYYENF